MIDRAYRWADDRFRIKRPLKEFFDHPVPEHVDPVRHPTAFIYCFGGLTFMFIGLAFVSGMFLLVYYVPSPDHAYDSVQYIMNDVTFGKVVRGIHHWSASATIALMALHMVRVFLTGSYKPPRELNWIIGVGLLATAIGMGFTGYLLPWDQKAYWATAVGTNIVGTVPFVGDFALRFLRGGGDLGYVSLARFFALHVWILPSILVVLMGLHFVIIRRQGISGPL
jgi:menaquinol-cytochrome c reductase cytochrome b subunit